MVLLNENLEPYSQNCYKLDEKRVILSENICKLLHASFWRILPLTTNPSPLGTNCSFTLYFDAKGRRNYLIMIVQHRNNLKCSWLDTRISPDYWLVRYRTEPCLLDIMKLVNKLNIVVLLQ